MWRGANLKPWNKAEGCFLGVSGRPVSLSLEEQGEAAMRLLMCSWVLMLSHCRCVWLSATLWTIACQVPLSIGILPGKNTRVGCQTLLQGIFQTRGLNTCLLQLLNWQVDSLSLKYLGTPRLVVDDVKEDSSCKDLEDHMNR